MVPAEEVLGGQFDPGDRKTCDPEAITLVAWPRGQTLDQRSALRAGRRAISPAVENDGFWARTA